MSSVAKRVMLTAVVSVVLGSSVAQAAFADGKITTITTRNYGSPVVVGAPVVIETPASTTTTVTRRVAEPVLIENSAPVIMERQTVIGTPVYSAPIVQERRVEVLNNALPSSTSTTVTRTTIERN